MTLPDPVYVDAHVALYQGDSRELVPELVKRHGRPAHVVQDPPYSKRTHEGARTLRGGEGPQELIDFAAVEVALVREVLAAAKPERWALSFADHVHACLLELAPPEGLRHIRTGAWVKPDCAPQLNGKHPSNGHESIAILHSAAAMRWNGGGDRAVWTHNVERSIDWHKTPKPLGLVAKLLRDFTDLDELVFDPFAGSGTTLVAAIQEGRRAVGVELDVHEKTIARLRYAAAQVPLWRPRGMRGKTVALDLGDA